MTQKVWRKAKALAEVAAASSFNAASAEKAKKPTTALTPNMRRGIAAPHERYEKRVRPANEALPQTHTGSGTYRLGDGEALVVYRPGAFDHKQYKSLGMGREMAQEMQNDLRLL